MSGPVVTFDLNRIRARGQLTFERLVEAGCDWVIDCPDQPYEARLVGYGDPQRVVRIVFTMESPQ